MLRSTDCILSQTTAGAKTRRVLRARGAGADAPLPWQSTEGSGTAGYGAAPRVSAIAEIPREQFPRSILVTFSRGSS